MSVTESDLKLEIVQVLFRHGARTPTQGEAKFLDCKDVEIYDPWDYEQLTNEGKQIAYKLGCNLRKRYNEFLGSSCDHRRFEVRTSDYDRTKMTLQLVLAGLFPPRGTKFSWNPNLDWTPIPYHYTVAKKDVLFKSYNSKRLKVLIQETGISDLEEKIAKYAKTVAILDAHGAKSIEAPIPYINAYVAIVCHKFMNMALPSWYKEEMYNDIQEIGTCALNAMSTSLEMKKINGGPLVKSFTENIEKGDRAKKLYLYSGHDINLGAFFNAISITGFCYPGFSSSIILETLRDSQNNRYVRLLWWPTVDEDSPVPMKIGQFDEFCPLADFLKLVQPVIPTENELSFLADDLM